MNIGFISQALPYIPSGDGFRLYGANLIRALAKRHRIHLISLLMDDDEARLDWARKYCASVTTIPTRRGSGPSKAINFMSGAILGRPTRYRRELTQLVQHAVRNQQWDIVHVEGGYAGGIVPSELPVSKVLSLHDSSTLRCEEMLRCSDVLYDKLYYRLLSYYEPRYERLVYPRYDRCVVVAERDRAAVKATVPEANLAVIPYGVDTEHYRTTTGHELPLSCVFHGNLSYAPNIGAVVEFVARILPRIRSNAEVRFRLVAADPTPQVRALADTNEIELIESPPDIRPWVSGSSVYVCPMLNGTGMKNKMLEAMAMEMPIVCYRPALDGIQMGSRPSALVVDDAERFSESVLMLMHDPGYAQRLGQNARELVETRYSWRSSAEAFESLYDELSRSSCSAGRERPDTARSRASVLEQVIEENLGGQS